MGKAFTETEKLKIKEDMMQTALDLFHENGKKALSIAELTRRAGIAQGSFYHFWKNKESLIIDLIAYRSNQKWQDVEKEFSKSLDDPIGFFSAVVCHYTVDLMTKIETQPIYQEAFQVFRKKNTEQDNSIEKLYGEFVSRLIRYWKENAAVKKADEKGLTNAFIGSFVLCAEHQQFDRKYFQEVLQTYIAAIAEKYIEI